MCKSSCNVTLLLNTITYYHYFVEQLTVFLKSYIYRALTGYGNSLITEAYIRNNKACFVGNVLKRKVTIEIGNRTCRSSLHNDTSSDDGITIGINNRTRNFSLRHGNGRTDHHQGKKEKTLPQLAAVLQVSFSLSFHLKKCLTV